MIVAQINNYKHTPVLKETIYKLLEEYESTDVNVIPPFLNSIYFILSISDKYKSWDYPRIVITYCGSKSDVAREFGGTAEYFPMETLIGDDNLFTNAAIIRECYNKDGKEYFTYNIQAIKKIVDTMYTVLQNTNEAEPNSCYIIDGFGLIDNSVPKQPFTIKNI